MEKISIEKVLKDIGYELTEADYTIIMDAASVYLSEGQANSSMIDLLSSERKHDVGFLFCNLPLDPELAAMLIYYFAKVKKLAVFM